MVPATTVFTGAFILAGAVLLVVAAFSTRQMLSLVEKAELRRSWQILLGLMVFFVLGYLGALALVVAGHAEWLQILAGVVFFFGSLFVLLVVRTGTATVSDLRREVRHRLAVEGELRKAKEAAEAAYRAKSTFLANMGHELRTPLNAIIGYAEMLEEDCEGSGEPESVEDIRRIRQAGQRLLGLIEDVLEMARLEAGRSDVEISDIVLDELVTGVVEGFRSRADAKGLELRVNGLGASASVPSDAAKVRSIVENLLDNAIRFTEEGQVAIAVLAEVDEVGVRVADTGVGMNREQVGRVFRAFTQVDDSATRARDGAGLGLAINERYVRLLGGRIEVESEPGQGSTFTVWLPSAGPPGL